MQQFYFCDIANATHAPLVLQMQQSENAFYVAFATLPRPLMLQKQQYNPKLLRMQQWNVLPVLHMQQ